MTDSSTSESTTTAFRSQEDQQIRETFLELRKECFELEKIKFRRMREAAQQRMSGGAELPKIDGVDEDDGKKNRVAQQREADVGVFGNWKRVLIFAAIILLINARRIINLYDLAFNPPPPTVEAKEFVMKS